MKRRYKNRSHGSLSNETTIKNKSQSSLSNETAL